MDAVTRLEGLYLAMEYTGDMSRAIPLRLESL